MLKKAKLNLFWFLKPGTQLDLDQSGGRRTYVQQVLTHGRLEDVREMLGDIGIEGVRQVFEDIKRYVPRWVRLFWEDFFADHHTLSK